MLVNDGVYVIYFPLNNNRMFRAIPVSNKLCFDREVKRSWKIHESKLNKLRSKLSQDKPQKFEFLDTRPKKIALQDVRNMQIDRENQALMKRIKTIESKGCKTSYARMYNDLSEHKKKTLNEPYRKRELVKIIGENQDILKRLQGKRSAYSIKQMEKERKNVEKNISLISEFKYKDFPRSHTAVNMWATEDSRVTPLSPSRVQNSFTFKGQRVIDDKEYSVTAYMAKGMFFLELEGQNEGEKYRIELPQQQARELLRVSYRGEIETLVEHLSIDGEKGMCYLRYSAYDGQQ